LFAIECRPVGTGGGNDIRGDPRGPDACDGKYVMRLTLRILLIVLGVSALMIALSILLLGAGATVAAGEAAFDAATGWRGPASPPWPPAMDNELRFYAALWGAYGVLLLITARNLDARWALIPWLAAAFFVGGIGRALSWLVVGTPHPFFLTLMAIELVLPPVMVLLWHSAGRSQSARP
jgi:hypothetical protein